MTYGLNRDPTRYARRTAGRLLTAVCAAAFLAACGGGDGGAEDGGMEEGQAAGPVVDPAVAATVTGSIAFQGTAPEPQSIDMAEEPTCAERYEGQPTTQSVIVNDNGTLKNVFVYVKSGLPADLEFPTPQDPVVLDQVGCRYEPHVFGIQVGQTLEIQNSDGILHNINAKPEVNRGFNISQPREMSTTRTFAAPEIMVPLECDVHGWMNAYAGVLEHPYFDTSGDDGSFTIENLPPGTYVIEAWHEEYGTQTQEVTVGEAGTAEVSFTFGPAAA